MLRDVFMLGERLAGQKDTRLRRGLAFAFAEALTVAAPYALVLFFVKQALERRLTPPLIGWTTAGIALSVLLRLVCSGAAMSNLFIAAHALMGQARIRTADHLRRLPMGFFTQRRSGELAGVLTTDVALVEDVWSHTIGIFSASFALPMLVGLGLSCLDWRLGLVVLAALPLALLVLAWTTPIFVCELEAVLDATADATARVVEYVHGIAVLRTFGRHGEVYRRLVRALERLRDALIRADVLPSPLLALFGLVIEGSFVALAWAGSALA
ncbi:MAG TPA: ABC transporter transmembrane domain-containing protein, partial [Polyangiales bacterium]